MSYRFNKDTRNSKNNSFNKRGEKLSRSFNDSKRPDFNERQSSRNIINRTSIDKKNKYSGDNSQTSRRPRNPDEFVSNYRDKDGFHRKPSTRNNRGSNYRPTKNEL